ncbi:uncharacterized protein AC631_03179 [Debaryomyces fabryi]|uniref:Uncharacterized protein n=1 Tax=Debaryomyces fabryi TaxID=58627 RepID=A0A0V1PYN6_9ASCO|nr:uncharacterized protein AC631_03179 [Debaryomyces fabryi]KSA01055.1 hypothetical protein AC631_03179 [Debaryomyces fabryi]
MSSSKFGIVLEKLSMLLIFDIREYSDPIVIHQTNNEGIEDFQWIPPTEKDTEDKDDEPGAYTNCKQLLIFTKHNLQVKLFSLDCTQMLWKIDKPISNEILIRPGLKNTIWSLVVNSELPITSDAAPVICHFYNEGSISNLLYKFKFSTNTSHTMVNWSDSGKWLCNLNSVDSLFGFDLQIYNSLGVYRKPFNQVSDFPIGDPIINLNNLNKGIVDHPQDNSLISYGSLEYLSQWIQIAPNNAEYLLIASTKHTDDSCKVELILVSIKSFGIINRSLIPDAPVYNVWKQFRDPSTRTIRYRKTLNTALILKSSCRLKTFLVENTKIANWACLQVEGIILLYKIFVEDGSSVDRNATYNLEAAVHVTSKILSLRLFKTENEDVKFLITTEDHIATYDFSKQSLEVLYTSSTPTRIREVFVFQKNKATELMVINDSIEHINWQIILYANKTEDVAQTNDDDSNFSLMKKFQYHEDNSKVVGLMKDVQHSEWGQGLRIKRNRFNYNRPSLTENTDDVTDTFNLQKRPKR